MTLAWSKCSLSKESTTVLIQRCHFIRENEQHWTRTWLEVVDSHRCAVETLQSSEIHLVTQSVASSHEYLYHRRGLTQSRCYGSSDKLAVRLGLERRGLGGGRIGSRPIESENSGAGVQTEQGKIRLRTDKCCSCDLKLCSSYCCGGVLGGISLNVRGGYESDIFSHVLGLHNVFPNTC